MIKQRPSNIQRGAPSSIMTTSTSLHGNAVRLIRQAQGWAALALRGFTGVFFVIKMTPC